MTRQHSDKSRIFAAYDWLPAPLRHEIAFSACTWDTPYMLGLYMRALFECGPDFATRWLVKSVRDGDDKASVTFGREYEARYGHPWPAVAAGATVLRYRPSTGVRRLRMTGNGTGPLCAAWRSSERLLPA